ncbi:hypothetical protein [Kocuria turfanensis]|uniref:Uncharacterized protein n=1 Tax=Kocuria turfanensis TaxID=388357 RepID=A0A512IEB7_9MICC|nr:hypothetical protein [Kocuria turfanensis]GEO96046.1 hypothetical protein KTU01_21690 [Kocuria turfanensis]
MSTQGILVRTRRPAAPQGTAEPAPAGSARPARRVRARRRTARGPVPAAARPPAAERSR